MLAASIPLSLAATNIAKLLAFLACLPVLAGLLRGRPLDPALRGLRTPVVALLMLAALILSLTWTTATAGAAGDALKYLKLLLIPAIVLLIRSPREASVALMVYVASQTFVVATSCLLYLGVPVPWVPAARNSVATVYSSYLDQTIMTAAFAAICWHMRHEFPGRRGAWIGAALAALSFASDNVFADGVTLQLATVTGMVRAGLGISVVPALTLFHFQQPGVVTRPLQLPGLTRQIYLVRRRDQSLSAAAQSLYEWMVARRPRLG